MEFNAVGRVENPETLDLEDAIMPIVGYTTDHTEVIVKIHFRAIAPLGVALAMLRAVDANGNISAPSMLDYLDGCVAPASREEWEAMLNGTEVYFVTETLSAAYTALGEYYADRPSPQRPGSRSGGAKTRPTTRGAASSRVSAGKS